VQDYVALADKPKDKIDASFRRTDTSAAGTPTGMGGDYDMSAAQGGPSPQVVVYLQLRKLLHLTYNAPPSPGASRWHVRNAISL